MKPPRPPGLGGFFVPPSSHQVGGCYPGRPAVRCQAQQTLLLGRRDLDERPLPQPSVARRLFAGARSISPAFERSESFPLGSGAGPYEGPSTAKRGVGAAPEGASMRPMGAGPLARKHIEAIDRSRRYVLAHRQRYA
jgi:hypothetical protein